MAPRIVPYIPPGGSPPIPRRRSVSNPRPVRGAASGPDRPRPTRRPTRRKESPAQAAFKTLALSFGSALAATSVAAAGTFIFLISNDAPEPRITALLGEPGTPAPAPAPVPAPQVVTVSSVTGNSLDYGGMSFRATALSEQDTTFGQRVCTQVTVVNESGTPRTVSDWAWALRSPDGIVTPSTLTTNYDEELGSGEIAAGSRVTGDVCFTGQPAESVESAAGWVILLEPHTGADTRLVWDNVPESQPPA